MMLTVLFLFLMSATRQEVKCQNFISDTREDLFSAMSQVEDLITRENEIVNVLDHYVTRTQMGLQAMKQYVSDFRSFQSTSSLSTKEGSVTTHPVDAYLILKRLTIDWGGMEDVISRHVNITQEMIQGIEYLREKSAFPEIEDLHGAAVALVRLQDIYKLNLTTLSMGYFTGIRGHQQEFQSVNQLTARDCLFVGKHAFNQGYYEKAIQWFETALYHSENKADVSAPASEILPFLEAAIKVHDDMVMNNKLRGVERQKFDHKDNNLAKNNGKFNLAVDTFKPKLFQKQSDDEEDKHYTRLCRGQALRPPEMDSKLKCRFYKGGSKYQVLVPLLLEEMSLDPYIVMLHDFLSHKETDDVIDQARPKLLTSRHRGQDGTYVASMVRTSKNAWLREAPEKKGDLLYKFSRRIEEATGLRAISYTAGEEYQVANYGIGGLYVPHTDYLMVSTDPSQYTSFEHFIGDRLATFMIYLSDVEAGGATVFPRAGVSVWPKKGAAVFWWNLHGSGIGDENTRHGACPVLHGSKWICNKWIHFHDQFLTHKCGKNAYDKFTKL